MNGLEEPLKKNYKLGDNTKCNSLHPTVTSSLVGLNTIFSPSICAQLAHIPNRKI
jgi:hypothetical protein